MVDPGATKSGLRLKENADQWFLMRWILDSVAFVTMQSRRPEKAVKPVLYSLLDTSTDTANGSFIEYVANRVLATMFKDNRKQSVPDFR